MLEPKITEDSYVVPSDSARVTKERSWIGVGAARVDQHRCSLFGSHDVVKDAPVVMGATSSAINILQQDPQSFAIDIGVWIVGTEDLGISLHGGPLPACSDDDGAPGIDAQVLQLASVAAGDQSDDLHMGHWMPQDTCIDHRRLDAGIGS